MGNIGLQLYSVHKSIEEDLPATLEKVAKMGYSGVQFAGFSNYSAVEVREKLDQLDLESFGAHVQISSLENQLEKTLEYHEIIGNDLIIIPWIPENMRTTLDDYKRTAEYLNGIGEKLNANGFTLAYHNHDFEFKEFDGKTGFDIIFENTESEHLKIELDCFWASYTSNNPLNIIEKYGDRCISLHIKDMKKENDRHISTELGTGNLPLTEYIRKGNEEGVELFIVEQEHFHKDPLESAFENGLAIQKIVKKAAI